MTFGLTESLYTSPLRGLPRYGLPINSLFERIIPMSNNEIPYCKSCKYSISISEDMAIACKEADIDTSNKLLCTKLIGFTAESKPYGGIHIASPSYSSKNVLVEPEFHCAYFEPTFMTNIIHSIKGLFHA